MEEHLQTSQFFEAVEIVREAIAQAEIKQTPLRVLSLDFQGAFDRNYKLVAIHDF
jgi:hypothetical protein